MAKERLDIEIEERDEIIAELKPKINRMQVQIDRLTNENKEMKDNNYEIQSELDSLRSVLLNCDSKQVQDALGVSTYSDDRVRSTMMVNQAIKDLDAKIIESDVLSRTAEKETMEIIEKLISGKSPKIGSVEI